MGTSAEKWGEAPLLLRSEVLQVAILPQRGGKIASLLDRRSGREWLAQPATGGVDPLEYGMPFTEGDMSGWDEMLPTIVAGPSPAGGGNLPDHGEVWSVPWTVEEADEEVITLKVEGRTLPFLCRRSARLESPDVLRLDYTIWVEGPTPVQLLWAAHPQFSWRTGGLVELPDDVRRVLDVLGRPSPKETVWDERLARHLDHAPQGTGRKLWLLPDQRPAWARVRDPDGGAVTLRWDPRQVPYLGVWFDACAYSRESVVALEPSTGFFDDLSVAIGHGRVTTVSAAEPLSWAIEVAASEPAV